MMMSCHGGGSKPVARRVGARSAGMLDCCSNASKRSATAGAHSWMAGSASLQDAQQAACRCSAAAAGRERCGISCDQVCQAGQDCRVMGFGKRLCQVGGHQSQQVGATRVGAV